MTARRGIQIDAVCDIETEDWDVFVAGGLLTADGTYEVYENPDDFWTAVLSVGGTIWAHNGGGFDYLSLLDFCVARKIPAKILGNGSIISVRVGGSLLCDSYKLFPAGLAKLTAGMGVQKEKLGLPCICGEDGCQGYCGILARVAPAGRRARLASYMRMAKDVATKERIRTMLRHGMTLADRERMLAYLRADCESLMAALVALEAFGGDKDLDLGVTVGGSAWKLARRRLGLPDSNLSSGEDGFIRSAYYGGRVETYFIGRIDAPIYENDVQSMYPWALATQPMPVGGRAWRYGPDAENAYSSGAPGFYEVTVTVPETCYIPPLPFRTPQRLLFPVGTFRAAYALPELQYALTLPGVTAEIHKALIFANEQVIFTPLMNELFTLRHAAPGGKSGPLGTFLKFLANSLTGKFGQRPDKEKFDLFPAVVRDCDCEARNIAQGMSAQLAREKGCDGRCHGHMETGIDGLYTNKEYRLDPCGHVEWAAYLTAVSRVKLHKQIVSCCDGHCALYCDTDGIYSIHPRCGGGDNLGEWEAREYQFIEIFGPKVYIAGAKFRAKGLHFTRPEQMVPGAISRSAGVSGLRGGARDGGFFRKSNVNRTLRRTPGGRTIESGPAEETMTAGKKVVRRIVNRPIPGNYTKPPKLGGEKECRTSPERKSRF